MRDLPQGAKPSATSLATAEWLQTYIEYSENVSPMTPRSFHQVCGLWLASTVIARRLRVPMDFGDIYPNVWALMVAQSTLYHKTTTLDVAKRIVYRQFPHLLLPDNITPQALVTDAAGKTQMSAPAMEADEAIRAKLKRDYAAQRSARFDEFSGFMAMTTRDYNSGLTEIFLKFYDCEERYEYATRGNGTSTVHNAYLPIIAASTPEAMSPYFQQDRLWQNGWWARFALLTPDNDRPEYKETRSVKEPEIIGATLKRLDEMLPKADYPNPLKSESVILGNGVYQSWKRYAKACTYDMQEGLDYHLQPLYGRLPTQALKVATLLAALDWTGRGGVVIEMSHLSMAVEITESWRENAHRILENNDKISSDDKLDKAYRRVLSKGTEGITASELGQEMHCKSAKEALEIVNTLSFYGKIEKFPYKPEKGRPTERVRAKVLPLGV